jgi:hypothetical protein
MANHPKLLVIPGTFLDAVEKLLKTAPPPKTAKARAQLERDKETVAGIRQRARKRARKAGTRKKAR